MAADFSKVWYFISLITVWLIQPICEHFFQGFEYLKLLKGIVFIATLLVIFFINTLLKKKYKEKHDYDYKIFFPSGNTVNNKSFEKIRINCIDNAGCSDLFTDEYTFKESLELLKEDTLISRPVYKKINPDEDYERCKYIVQCLFVPRDKNGNTLLIRRKKENHGSLMFGTSGNISFVSFSPVPDRYGEDFDPQQAYHREVYTSAYQYKISEFAVCLRNTRKNNYFFLIYTIDYPDVEFLTDGKTNMQVIDEIFGTRLENGEIKPQSHFQKDNDLIQRAITFEELKDLKEFNKKYLFNALKKGDIRSLFNINNYSKSIVMGVEKKIIQEILMRKAANN